MDYFGILKRAWNVAWRNKALWVLGLFAVGASSGGSGGGGGSGWRTSDLGEFEAAARWVEANAGLLIVLAAIVGVIGFAFFILSVAARGGLVAEVDRLERGDKVSLGRGWRTGFRYWFRIFGINVLLAIPILLLVGAFVALVAAGGIGLGLSGGSDLAAGGLVGIICLGIPVFVLLVIPLAIIIGILGELALRHAVIEDAGAIDAIKLGWDDLWGKRGAVMMWLVMLLPGLAFGVVIFLLSLPFIIAGIFAAVAESFVLAGVLFTLMVLVMLVPSALYGAFYSAAWTIFFRQMTGLEKVAEKVEPAMTGEGHLPPPPPGSDA